LQQQELQNHDQARALSSSRPDGKCHECTVPNPIFPLSIHEHVVRTTRKEQGIQHYQETVVGTTTAPAPAPAPTTTMIMTGPEQRQQAQPPPESQLQTPSTVSVAIRTATAETPVETTTETAMLATAAMPTTISSTVVASTVTTLPNTNEVAIVDKNYSNNNNSLPADQSQ
jgi:hypothetical protein